MKTILATAYAVNPYKGSEDGMGWNFIQQIARHNRVIAITRRNNRESIEKYMRENPSDLYARIEFVYYDLPYWMRFWKRGSRGALLYYWMWQRLLPRFVRNARLSFDIVHNVNFHNDWTPSYLWKLDRPFVWGPIGHHPQIPARYLASYGVRHVVQEKLKWLVKKFFWTLSPGLKKTLRHADHILCMNRDVQNVIRLEGKQHSIMPSVATEDFAKVTRGTAQFRLISAGRLVPLKGFDLTIRAFHSFLETLTDRQRANCELIIVGSGPQQKLYQEIVSTNGMDANVRFIEWIDRKDLMDIYAESSAFVFPSHEGAGMVVAEAMSFGLPVICLDNSGPGEFVDTTSGIAIKALSVEGAIAELASAIRTLFLRPALLADLSRGARRRFEERFTWDSRGDQLKNIYHQLAS